MKVGIFTDAYFPDVNGVVTSIQTLRDSLQELGHTVYIITNHKGIRVEYDSDRILRLPGLELKRFYGYKMSSPIQFEAEKYVRRMNLDVIHVQTEAGVGFFARHMAKTLNIPLVYTYHTMYEDYTHYLNPLGFNTVDHVEKKVVASYARLWGNYAQAVISPSEKTKKLLESYGVVTPVYVVPTGLDIEAFNRDKLDVDKVARIRQEYGLSDGDHVVVYVGRIAKEKMIEMLIEAVAYVKDEHLKLVIVGGGTDENFYHDTMKKFNVENKVIFAGKKPKTEIPYYYAAFDCFASASTSETQGMTYIEALATGLCVFGRRDPVLDELVYEDQTGYYFDDAHELANKFDYFFMKSKEERDAMRQACIEKTIPYKTSTFAQKAFYVYEQALSKFTLSYTVDGIQFEGDFVKLSLSREYKNENMDLIIPPDEFFDMNLEIGTKVDSYAVDNYKSLQNFYKSAAKCKDHLFRNDYTCYEMKQYCMLKQNLSEEDADMMVNLFKQRGWLDDEHYAKEKAEYWHSTGKGKREVEQKLREKGIDEKFISLAVESLDEDVEKDNAVKLAQKLSTTSKDQSIKLKTNRIKNKLIQKGYDATLAQEVVDSLDFEEDDEDIIVFAYRKAMRLYKNIEDDYKRNQKIKKYLYTQGFTSEKIAEVMEEEND